uniref:(northern house mosquito) hypothetical protein n=1 Tax=Culex pipiens TaxID=7175 RepID=A0A8D8IEX1_CULPI
MMQSRGLLSFGENPTTRLLLVPGAPEPAADAAIFEAGSQHRRQQTIASSKINESDKLVIHRESNYSAEQSRRVDSAITGIGVGDFEGKCSSVETPAKQLNRSAPLSVVPNPRHPLPLPGEQQPTTKLNLDFSRDPEAAHLSLSQSQAVLLGDSSVFYVRSAINEVFFYSIDSLGQ